MPMPNFLRDVEREKWKKQRRANPVNERGQHHDPELRRKFMIDFVEFLEHKFYYSLRFHEHERACPGFDRYPPGRIRTS
jgi:hypothetical protein